MESTVDFREGAKINRLRGVLSVTFWMCLGFLAAASPTPRPIRASTRRDRGHHHVDKLAATTPCPLLTWGVAEKRRHPLNSGTVTKSSHFAGTANMRRYGGRGVTGWTAAHEIGAGDAAHPQRTTGTRDLFDARNAANGNVADELCTVPLSGTCGDAILRIRCGGDSSYRGSGAGSGYSGYGYDDDRDRYGDGGGGGNHRGGRDYSYDGYKDDRYYSEATSGSRRRRKDDDYYADDDYYGESSRRRNDYYGQNDEDDDYYRSSSASQSRRRAGNGNNIPGLSSSLLTRGNKKIGTMFAGAGALLTLLGISMFFHKTLLRMGNICFMIGIPLFIGPGRTAGYFLQPKKARATACLLLGMFLVLVGRPILGIALETFGILNLFGNMFPVFLALARSMPVVGDLLGSGGGNKKKGKREQQQWRQEEDSRYYDDGGLPRRGDEDDAERYY